MDEVPKNMINWAHAAPSIIASFLASLVECIEALTVILAIGSVRGWRSALYGSAVAIASLLLLVAVVGHALTRVPLHRLQLIVGILLLLFGLRWLRKAILRSAGAISLHDEDAAFTKNVARMRNVRNVQGWDGVAFASALEITLLEGMEVVFIVLAIGASGVGLLLPASLGALAALVVIVVLGILLHRPLASVPENKLKFAVGVLLSAFGTFWVGEGAEFFWPGGDWSILALLIGYLAIAMIAISASRNAISRANACNTVAE